MKTSELRQKTDTELKKLLQEKKEKLGNLNFALAGGKVKNIREIHQTKKDIAKILTLMNEKTSDVEAKEIKTSQSKG